MTVENPRMEPATRGFAIHIHDAGRKDHLAALLIDLGLDPRELVSEMARQGVTVRLRARSPASNETLQRLSHRLVRLQPLVRRSAGWLVTCGHGELEDVAAELAASPSEDDAALGRELHAALHATFEPLPFTTTIGSRRFAWGQRTYVMGIINVTPDSFSGDGILAEEDTGKSGAQAAVEQALAMEEAGADLLDIGAESTRPGAAALPAQEELGRLMPVLCAVRAATSLPLSVDTYKAEVARAALAEGADLVNDVRGLAGDGATGMVIARQGVPAVFMHNRLHMPATGGTQGGHYEHVAYGDLVLDLTDGLAEMLDTAMACGIPRDRIILDPGLGFGKTVEQSLRLVDLGGAFRALGQPLLLGPSRKSFIGYTLGLAPAERVFGTMSAVAVAIARGGADIVRVHDVRAAVQTVQQADAIVGSALPPAKS